MRDPKSILITGAGKGIGAALARAYAEKGVSLFLCDINKLRLDEVCETCSGLGANVYGVQLSVADRSGMEAWINETDSMRPLELVIANAGISHGNLPDEETADQIREVFDVNLNGTLNTVLPALSLLRKRKRGQIAVMGSLAGMMGVPHAPSYCASKAAIRIFAQGVRARVKREGVSVTAVIPAFVKTPMTGGNLYDMPWIIEADEAANIIKTKLARDKPEFVFPSPYNLVSWFINFMPSSIKAMITQLK